MTRFPLLGEPREIWHSRGACRIEDREVFHGTTDEPVLARMGREETAKRICARCPVLVECREYALRADQLEGVWGGLTPVERRMILDRTERRRLRREPQPPVVAVLG